MIDKAVTDKMTSMMLGTSLTEPVLVHLLQTMSWQGKLEQLKLFFNPEYTSDQWVIGYTPDVVISHWLGFPTTDENHYLAGSTSNGAAHVFRNIANTILPYTPGSTFTVENAYKQNGIAPANTKRQVQTNIIARQMIICLIFEDVRKV